MQQAITLDSLGRSMEAKALYQTLKGHQNAVVSKKVSQLLGGFKAMEFLKADQFTYGADRKSAYKRYMLQVKASDCFHPCLHLLVL